MYIEGAIPHDRQPKYLKKREIAPILFLAVMANHKNHMLYDDSNITLHNVEVNEAQDSELYGGNDDVIYEEIHESLSDKSDTDMPHDKDDTARKNPAKRLKRTMKEAPSTS